MCALGVLIAKGGGMQCISRRYMSIHNCNMLPTSENLSTWCSIAKFITFQQSSTMVVLELLRWKAPAALILAVVLLQSNSKIVQPGNLDCVECFAGDGAVSMALWDMGMRGSSHDIRYNKLLDFCSPHGFACLGLGYMVPIIR